MLADRQTDRQTDRHGRHNTQLPYRGRSNEFSVAVPDYRGGYIFWQWWWCHHWAQTEVPKGVHRNCNAGIFECKSLNYEKMTTFTTVVALASSFFGVFFELFRPAASHAAPPSPVHAFTARRYASAAFAVILCPSVRPSVCHKPVLYRNDRTNRAGFWHGGFLPPIPHRVIRTPEYLLKLEYFPL